jgi:phosphatidylinositol alpha-1,6-mannosyltransferase
MPRTLVITNDFPPRKGGIQTFVSQLVSQMYPRSVVVYTSNWSGAAEFDQTLPYDVIRADTSMLLPTPKQIRKAKQLVKQYDCDQVLFGALAPLGLMSGPLKRAGIKQVVAITHGHEAGWAKIPVLRTLLKLSARKVDVVTYLTDYTKKLISPLLNANSEIVQLTPAVDADRYLPYSAENKEMLRTKYELNDKLILLGLSRLMPRKGFDSVIKVLPKLIKKYPNLIFLVAGSGPDQKRLKKLAVKYKVSDRVKFLGAITFEQLPDIYNLADVFAMPCRSRFNGLDIEGFGIVYLEAAACALPVVAGDSGGAVEAVQAGQTGELVSKSDLFPKLDRLLADSELRIRYGRSGRKWVQQSFELNSRGKTLIQLLEKRKND